MLRNPQCGAFKIFCPGPLRQDASPKEAHHRRVSPSVATHFDEAAPNGELLIGDPGRHLSPQNIIFWRRQ